MTNEEKSYVPVYLPDRTQIGEAHVNVADGTAVIHIQSDSNLAELIKDSLVGLSVMYLAAKPSDGFKKEGEETDGESS